MTSWETKTRKREGHLHPFPDGEQLAGIRSRRARGRSGSLGGSSRSQQGPHDRGAGHARQADIPLRKEVLAGLLKKAWGQVSNTSSAARVTAWRLIGERCGNRRRTRALRAGWSEARCGEAAARSRSPAGMAAGAGRLY